jgi:citrate synthase
MGIVKDRFKEKAEKTAAEIKELLKEHGNKVIGEVQLSQVYQGMRGMTGLVTETSLLDAQDGIRFRGYSISELREKLPKASGGSEPPGRFILFNAIGELPTEEDVQHITSVLQRRVYQIMYFILLKRCH